MLLDVFFGFEISGICIKLGITPFNFNVKSNGLPFREEFFGSSIWNAEKGFNFAA
jgi:uncharacterized membrane protein